MQVDLYNGHKMVVVLVLCITVCFIFILRYVTGTCSNEKAYKILRYY